MLGWYGYTRADAQLGVDDLGRLLCKLRQLDATAELSQRMAAAERATGLKAQLAEAYAEFAESDATLAQKRADLAAREAALNSRMEELKRRKAELLAARAAKAERSVEPSCDDGQAAPASKGSAAAKVAAVGLAVAVAVAVGSVVLRRVIEARRR